MGFAVILTCLSLTAVDGTAVNGDTVKCDGVSLRPMGDGAPFRSGFDAPEVGRWSHCPEANELGLLAKKRMAEFLKTPGIVVEDSGEIDRWKRPLVWLRLPDGSTIGSRMIEEGHAKVWLPGVVTDWCEK